MKANPNWSTGNAGAPAQRLEHRAENASGAYQFLLSAVIFVLMLLPGVGAAANPRLAGLNVEIWPEFDRPAALVILKAEIAASAVLPAEVTLRITSASGGPSAVAFADAAMGGLLNLQYERKDTKDFITLRFKAPQRFFQVEFYEPFAVDQRERKYTYVWPGDLATDRLSVTLQEPAGASDLSVQPELGMESTGANGLRYRSGDLGIFEAGRRLPIEIRYSKTDKRLSAELIKSGAGDPAPQTKTFADRWIPGWIVGITVGTPLLLAVAAGLLWWRRRVKLPASAPAGFCTRCGKALAQDDRFCSGCGAARG